MSTDEHKAIARQFAEIFSTGNTALLDAIAAPSFQAHLPGAPGPLDREGWKQYLVPFLTGFADRALPIEALVAEADQVVARVRFRGVHRGEFQGIPPTGRAVEFTGFAMFRIADGKVVEHWGDFDALGLLQQLGAIPAPGSAGT